MTEPNEVWAMRQFAQRAFAILQREEDLGSSSWRQLTDVEITDDQGRTARATARADAVGVVFKIISGPVLVGDSDDSQVDDSVDTRQAAFKSYWRHAGLSSPESYEKCAREAFLAGLARRDTGQPA